MGGLTCKNCKQTSYVPPNSQHIRCKGCSEIYFVGHADDSTNVVQYKGSKDLRLESELKKTEAKHRGRGLMKKLHFSNEQQPNPPPAVSITDRPPQGRRALLCGVTYKKTKHELKGSAQDVKNMRDLLLKDYHFPLESILILAEDEGYKLPTRKNIEEGFRWLMRGIQRGDSLVFYFSGHGKRQRDYNGDEKDGFDETICPMDFDKYGMILDNYMNEAIVRPLTEGVTLHAIMDSCHSGTVLDLPRVYDIATGEWEDNSPPSGAFKGTSGGMAICFSACEDYQLAADTSVFSSEKEMTGAMTITFINAVKASLDRNEKISYKYIMDSMHQSIKQAGKPGGFFGGIRRIFHRRILQDPLLSSTEEFNASSKEFKL